MNQEIKPSIQCVVFAMIFCFPIGLVLLYIRLYKRKSKRGFLIASFIFFALDIIYLRLFWGFIEGMIFTGDFFTGLGLTYLIGAILSQRDGQIEDTVQLSCGDLMRANMIAAEEMCEDIYDTDQPEPQPCITQTERNSSDIREIPNTCAEADRENGEIDNDRQSLLSDEAGAATELKTQQETQRREPRQRPLRCPYCGGDNKVTEGQVCECKYCGSYISYDME